MTRTRSPATASINKHRSSRIERRLRCDASAMALRPARGATPVPPAGGPITSRAKSRLTTQLWTRLGNTEAVLIRTGIDLDDDPLDGDDRRLAPATDRFHCNEAGRFHLRQRTRKVRLRPSRDLREFRYRLRLAIPDDREKLAVLWRQQPHHDINRIEARLGGIGGRRPLAARHCSHLFFKSTQALNLVPSHLVTSSLPQPLITASGIPRSVRTRCTSRKKS